MFETASFDDSVSNKASKNWFFVTRKGAHADKTAACGHFIDVFSHETCLFYFYEVEFTIAST